MIVIDHEKCIKCGGCVSVCPVAALIFTNKVQCNEKCINCGNCIKFCPVGALKLVDK